MLTAKDKGTLIQILIHCERIVSKINKLSKSKFLLNMDYQEIVMFNLIQIGELINHLSSKFINEKTEINWQLASGMRNHIVHGYNTIDYELVYLTAKNDIPKLLRYCKKIIKDDL